MNQSQAFITNFKWKLIRVVKHGPLQLDIYRLLDDPKIQGDHYFRCQIRDKDEQSPITGVAFDEVIKGRYDDKKRNVNQVAQGAICFMGLIPGNTDEEYFTYHTEKQLEWVYYRHEDMQIWENEFEEDYDEQ